MPIERCEWTTDVPEVGHQLLNDVFASDRAMKFSGSSTDFRFQLRTSLAGIVYADRLHHSMTAGAVTDPYPSFMTARVVGGSLRFAYGGEDVLMRPGEFARYPTDTGLVCSWEDVDLELVRLPLETIDEAAALGSDTAAPVQFYSMQAASPAGAKRWVALSRFVHEMLDGADAPAEAPIVAQQLAGIVATTALAVFPNSAMTAGYTPDAGWATPATIQRAMEFIDANADRPITVAEIAEAAGIGVRSLQSAFLRHRGLTPMGYARRVRLERAYYELQAADPAGDTTVKMIAARWGFAKPDRFSAFYREAFGVLPSHTLRM